MRGTGLLSRLFSRGPHVISMEEGYARWAPIYPPHPHNPVMSVEASIVQPLVQAAVPRRALDVGTGTGRNVQMLHDAGASFVVGVDMSSVMLSHARAVHARVCGDACRLPFADQSFDLVCSSLMCGDIADLGAWLGEAARVLAPGGHLVYSDFHPSWHILGWRRTFVADDRRTYELPLFPHELEEHHDRLLTQGLEIRAVYEPTLAGGSTPVVAIFHAFKPPSRATPTETPRSAR